MLDMKHPLRDMRAWGAIHRSYLTPEQREQEDRDDRREVIKAGAVAAGSIIVFASVTLLPWALGVAAIWRSLFGGSRP